MASDDTRKLTDLDSERTRLVARTGPTPAKGTTRNVEEKTKLMARPVPGGGPSSHEESATGRLVTGWLVVVSGPGRGRYAPIFDGMNSVGRDPDQVTRVDFGDDAISRSEHAFITYDYVERRFYVHPGGKPNLIRIDDKPVLQPTEIKAGTRISIGHTTFAFASFCGEAFDWQDA